MVVYIEYVCIPLLSITREILRSCLVHLKNQKKKSRFPVTSNLTAHAWSIGYRRKQKLIAQFTCKSRDESFELS